jgi:lipopolysaccharide export system permease protein
MKILDRYIAGRVGVSVVLVLAGLLILFTFTSFLGELKNVGKGHYTVGLALVYVVLMSPRWILELFPVSALLGSVMALGLMANANELAVLRSAGLSIGRITWPVLKVGALLMIVALALGEGVAPAAERYAHDLRTQAITGESALRTAHGVWTRYAGGYLHIGNVLADDRLGDVTVYERAGPDRLRSVVRAQRARYVHGRWLFEGVREVRYSKEGLKLRTAARLFWPLPLKPGQLQRLVIPPQDLSVAGLYEYVHYLRGTGQDAGRYALVLWQKLSLPVVTAVMVVLAVPFVFGSLRAVAIGQRMVAAALVGIGFQLLQQTAGQATLLYHLPPSLGAFLPAGLALMLIAVLWRRVH